MASCRSGWPFERTTDDTLAQPTNLTQEIWEAAAELLGRRLPPRRLKVRLLGVGVSGLERSNEIRQRLFADPEREAQSRLDATADQIKARFGGGSLRGSSLGHHVSGD
jgi:hypothetical protein